MIPLPVAVQVGPFRYTVTTDPEVLRDIERQERASCFGGANHRKLTIAVDASIPMDQQRDTLWHEVRHAIDNLAAIGGDDKISEEESVERTCSLELLVLRTNPALVQFLLGDDDAQEETAVQRQPREELPGPPSANGQGEGVTPVWEKDGSIYLGD